MMIAVVVSAYFFFVYTIMSLMLAGLPWWMLLSMSAMSALAATKLWEWVSLPPEALREKRTSIGHFLATVEFDYLEAHGHGTRCIIDVCAVDHEALKGFCRNDSRVRTFALDHINGKILNRISYEMLAPAD